MAFLAKKILNDVALKNQLSNQAVQSSHPALGVKRMLDEYELFYEEIVTDWVEMHKK